jgi:hypothetical protein
MSKTRPRRLKVQFFRHPEGTRLIQGWRWRIRAENGRIVAASSEGYRRRFDCGRNFTLATGFLDQGRAEWIVVMLRTLRLAALG